MEQLPKIITNKFSKKYGFLARDVLAGQVREMKKKSAQSGLTGEEGRTAIRGKIDKFHTDQELIRKEFEQEKEARSVEEISKREGIFFIHTMSMDGEIQRGTASNNSQIDAGKVDIKTRLKLIMGLSPALSCSTIKIGEGRERMTQSSGIILSRGTVLHAKGQDAFTVTEDNPLMRRSKDQDSDYDPLVSDIQKDPAKNIKAAIDREGSGYLSQYHNELIIENPECGGIFFDQDSYNGDIEQLRQLSVELGVPLYVWKDGRMFLYGGEEINSSQVVDVAPVLSDEAKKQFLADAVAENPFRINSKVERAYKSYKEGEVVYDSILSGKSPRGDVYTSFAVKEGMVEGGLEAYLQSLDKMIEGVGERNRTDEEKMRQPDVSYKGIRHIKEDMDGRFDVNSIYTQVYSIYEIAQRKGNIIMTIVLAKWLQNHGVFDKTKEFVAKRIGENGELKFIPDEDVPKEVKERLKL